MISILRVKHWYKNLILFVPLIFSSNLFNTDLLLLSIIGFFSMCFASSFNYIINDLIDLPRDKVNPLKKHKPLVSGAVSRHSAIITALIMVFSSLIIALLLPNNFWVFPSLLIINTSLYSYWLKNYPIIDLLLIGFNFFIRVIAGGVLINVKVTNWLLLMIFVASLMLGASKRYSSLKRLGKKAVKARPVFNYYSTSLLKLMIVIFSSVLLIVYCLYSILSPLSDLLVISIPLFFFMVLRYFFLVISDSDAGVKAELAFTDKQFLIGFLLWFFSVLFAFY